MIKVFVAAFLILLIGSCDGGTCRNDWVAFEESCYAFIDEKVTWSTAVQICRVMESHLLEIRSEAENNFLNAQLNSRGFHSAWTGIQDFLREGTWVYSSDQQPVTYFRWAHSQPDNNLGSEGGEDCVILSRDGYWDDYWCDNTHNSNVVCKYIIPEDGMWLPKR